VSLQEVRDLRLDHLRQHRTGSLTADRRHRILRTLDWRFDHPSATLSVQGVFSSPFGVMFLDEHQEDTPSSLTPSYTTFEHSSAAIGSPSSKIFNTR